MNYIDNSSMARETSSRVAKLNKQSLGMATFGATAMSSDSAQQRQARRGHDPLHGPSHKKTADIDVNACLNMSNLNPDGKDVCTSVSAATLNKLNVPITTSTAGIASVNWVDRGATTAIKNQQFCGACWAHGSTEQIESDFFLKTGQLLQLAPQQLVTCGSEAKALYACSGGTNVRGYEYVKEAGGLMLEKDYAYVSGNPNSCFLASHCAFDGSKVAVKVDDYTVVSGKTQLVDVASDVTTLTSKGPGASEAAMFKQIQESPMAVTVATGGWEAYKSGIVNAAVCGTAIDHDVQVVGFREASKTKPAHWIVRNSWGANWGANTDCEPHTGADGGYICLEAGTNTCNITATATTVATSAP
jgi:hypothetical protein